MNPHQPGYGGRPPPPQQAYQYGQQQPMAYAYPPRPHQQQQWLIQQQQARYSQPQPTRQDWGYQRPQLPQEVRDLFASIDTARSGRVSGAQVASLLSRSGLSREVLRHIWDVADSGRLGSLDILAFSLALRLIALAQWTGVVAADQADLARHEARTGRPFTMPRFVSNSLAPPQTRVSTPQTRVSTPPPQSTSPAVMTATQQAHTSSPVVQPTPTPIPIQQQQQQQQQQEPAAMEDDAFGDFAQVSKDQNHVETKESPDDVFGDFGSSAQQPISADEDAFGDFDGSASLNDPEVSAETSGTDGIDTLSAEEATMSPDNETPTLDTASPAQEPAPQETKASTPNMLDQMLGAALRGEDISAKKSSARRSEPIMSQGSTQNKSSAFVDNSSLHTKLSVFDAMAELDVAVATADWDDFADAETTKPTPDPTSVTKNELGDFATTTAPAADDDFGDFDGPSTVANDNAADDFGDFDGPSTVANDNAANDFGAFDKPITGTTTADDFGDFDGPNTDTTAANDFGAFDGPTIGTTNDAPTAADFGDFNGPTTGISTTDTFGAFDSPTAGTTDDKPADDFGDIDGTTTGTTNADTFGAFDGPTSVTTHETPADDFGDFDGPTTGTANAEDFGAFDGPDTLNDRTSDAFGDFGTASISGIESAQAGHDEFGDFDGAGLETTMKPTRTTIDEAFGDLDESGDVGVKAQTQAGEEDFGEFDEPAQDGFGAFVDGAKKEDFGDFAQPSANKGAFSAFDTKDEAFGDFDQGGAQESFGAFKEDEAFGDFENAAKTNESAFDADFGDFDAAPGTAESPPARTTVRTLETEDLNSDHILSGADSSNDIFATLRNYVPPQAPASPVQVELSLEDIMLRLIEKRRFGQVAILQAAGQRKQELASTKEAMDAAAKALRFEEAITLRSKLEALEARVPRDEMEVAAAKISAVSSTEALSLTVVVDSVRKRSVDASQRLVRGIERRLGVLVGRDQQISVLDEKLTRMRPESATAVQAWAMRAAARALYARNILGGDTKDPPVVWSAILDAALGVLTEGLDYLDRAALLVKEEPGLLGEDRNTAKKISDLVRSLIAAIEVARSVQRAHDLALYSTAQSVPDLDAAEQRLSEYAGVLDPEGAKVSTVSTHNKDIDDDFFPENDQDEFSTNSHDLLDAPSTLTALESMVHRGNTLCGLTLRRLTPLKTIRYDDQPFLAPAINLWLNLVSLRPPRDFDESSIRRIVDATSSSPQSPATVPTGASSTTLSSSNSVAPTAEDEGQQQPLPSSVVAF